jgi:hypothetical protein
MLSARSAGGGNGILVSEAVHDLRLNNMVVASDKK